MPRDIASDVQQIWGHFEPLGHLEPSLRQIDFLMSDPVITLGRANKCDVVLSCPHISDLHCDLMWNGIRAANSASIRDCNSRNGTFINETRIPENCWQVLHDGDLVSFTPPGIKSRDIDYSFVFHYNLSWKRHSNRLVGEYELGPVLDGGARSSIFRGVHTHTGEHVALKRLDLHEIQQAILQGYDEGLEEERNPGLRELSVLSRLRHPFVVRFEGLYRMQQEIYIVFEFVAGGTLEQWISEFIKVKNRYLLEAEVKHFAYQIFEALRYVHSRGVAHRDVKPANLLLSSEGNIRLADFGEAVIVLDGSAHSNGPAGTPAYMAPEAARGDSPGYAADVYSAATIVCQLLTGWIPNKKQAKRSGLSWDEYLHEEMTYAKLSDPCIQWFLSALDQRPHMRSTAAQALDHQWLATFVEAHAVKLSEEDLPIGGQVFI